ncbi:uncharacterized protein LOC131616871 [Vicia villosa]|uniref:uncharacterized protein LOC131616871 n=1 Tax=Vicia villosa TaxID=3911 RepID=UPI00273C1FEC|nr:uncharacterized protein LOC131616871 [Vicia villosa]
MNNNSLKTKPDAVPDTLVKLMEYGDDDDDDDDLDGLNEEILPRRPEGFLVLAIASLGNDITEMKSPPESRYYDMVSSTKLEGIDHATYLSLEELCTILGYCLMLSLEVLLYTWKWESEVT